MSWLKVDDGFNTHPKVCRLDEEFAPSVAMNARAVWLTVGVYCAHARSPFVEIAPLRKLLPCSREELGEAIGALVKVGLIDDTDHGLEVHDWGHYVPPSSTERVQEHRQRKKAKHDETVTRVSETVTRATRNAETLPLPSPPGPSRPDPIPPLDSSLRSESCAVRAEPHDGESALKPRSKREVERRATAKRIFAFWQSELGHELALDTEDKLRKIEARLREYERGHDPENPETEPEFICKTAIVGIGRNPFNTGDNPRGKRYDSIGLIFRSNEKTDEYFTDGIEEMRRRVKAERAKVAETPKAEPRLPPPHVPQERREETPRYVRSFECMESFYGAQAKPGAERLEALRAHVAAYPDDTEAKMALVLAGAL